MKNFLPCLGALALGASLVFATHDKATAQNPTQGLLAPSRIEVIQFLPNLSNPISNPGVALRSDGDTTIELKEGEFIVTSKVTGKYHVPMTSVAWYRVRGEL